MKCPPLALALAFAFAFLALPPLTLAAEPTKEAKAKAKSLLSEGDIAYRLQHFEQALVRYQEAYKLVEHPAVLFNVAQSFRQLKRTEKALFYYKMFVTDWQTRFPDRPVPYEQEVRVHIAALQAELDRVAQQVADRERKEQEAKAEAERRKAEEARARAALKAPVEVRLSGLRPGSRVHVNGQPAQGPVLRLKSGKYRLRVEASGFHDWSTEAHVKPATPMEVKVGQEVTDLRAVLLWTSVGATAVAAGFLGMGIAYNLEHNRYILDTPEADENRDLSVIGYAVAGGVAALAVAGWTVYLLHRKGVLERLGGGVGEDPTERASFGVGPTRGGAALFGRVFF